MKTIETFNHNGQNYEIIIHEFERDNPRNTMDNFGKMICFHRRYCLGDKHELSVDTVKSMIQKDDIIYLPLYLYDHSGITMNYVPFSCRWDSGQVGVIYCTKEDIRKEYNLKRVSKQAIEKAIELMKSEVKVYDEYLIGYPDYCFEIPSFEIENFEYGVFDNKNDCLKKAKETIIQLSGEKKNIKSA